MQTPGPIQPAFPPPAPNRPVLQLVCLLPWVAPSLLLFAADAYGPCTTWYLGKGPHVLCLGGRQTIGSIRVFSQRREQCLGVATGMPASHRLECGLLLPTYHHW